MRPPADGPTGLYRTFGDADVLLYIGIGIDVSIKRRLRYHAKYAAWADEIRRVDVKWYDSWPEAKAAETEAIRTEKPRYNLAENEWNQWNWRISTIPPWSRPARPMGNH